MRRSMKCLCLIWLFSWVRIISGSWLESFSERYMLPQKQNGEEFPSVMIFNLCPFMYTVLVRRLRILAIPIMEAAVATHIPADIIPAIALNIMGV